MTNDHSQVENVHIWGREGGKGMGGSMREMGEVKTKNENEK